MPIEKGSFILVDYTVTVKETGEPVETTMEEEAKQLGIYRAGEVYEPRLIIVGEGWVLKGVEEVLPNLKQDEPVVVEVPPDRGVGSRDPSKVRLIPLRRFPKDSRPKVGDRVEVDGRIGIVRAVGAGRVQVDFNHPLAGKTLVYKIILRKALETVEEKIAALLKRRFPGIDVGKTIIRVTERRVEVELPSDIRLTEGIQLAKRGFTMDVARYIGNIDEVVFIERYRTESREGESAS
ncbi:MAG: FKBP-type peptidyl-prolyl cis-trans isomerase [Candidatus Bathyarchaeia archaeon]|nr:FKBP-type peptidyl-prolyl cis-trans isomerase [Candidatus Bathyarchaeota archaeon]